MSIAGMRKPACCLYPHIHVSTSRVSQQLTHGARDLCSPALPLSMHSITTRRLTAAPYRCISDVKFAELRSIIQFMYKGEVEVDQTEIESLICTAEGLMIRGESGESTGSMGFRPISLVRKASTISEEGWKEDV